MNKKSEAEMSTILAMFLLIILIGFLTFNNTAISFEIYSDAQKNSLLQNQIIKKIETQEINNDLLNYYADSYNINIGLIQKGIIIYKSNDFDSNNYDKICKRNTCESFNYVNFKDNDIKNFKNTKVILYS